MQAISSPADAESGLEPKVGKYAIPASLGQQRLWFLQELDASWGRAHQIAFAIVQASALNAVERGDGEIDFLAAGAILGIQRELGKPAHVAHIVCGQPH